MPPARRECDGAGLAAGDRRIIAASSGNIREARAGFDQEASAYWNAISEKRRGRNAKRRERIQITLDDYVLEHPPLYTGPKRPVNPEPEETPERPQRRGRFQVVSDFVSAAQELYQFTPQRRPPRTSSSAPMRATRSPQA